MKLISNEYSGRLKHWQRTLQQDFYMPVQPIVFEGFVTMEQLTPEDAAKGDFAPIPEGFAWGHTWEYMWIRRRSQPSDPLGGTYPMPTRERPN